MVEGIHPFQHLKSDASPPPKCFAVKEWKGYLDKGDVPRCVKYVQQNPARAGLPPQVWRFVTAAEY